MKRSASALLVIDVQQSFLKMPYWSENGLAKYQTSQSRLIEYSRSQHWPVIFIYHTSRGPFKPDSGLVAPMDWIDQQPGDPVFYKRAHNALSESGLQPWLEQRGISHLVISGIRTEQCCESTARYASDSGFEVDFILDATLTFSMKDTDDRTASTEEVKSRTAMVLQQRFATVMNTEAYIETPATPALNRQCPRSGKPVAKDSIIDYRGYLMGFCNTGCSSDFASNPSGYKMDCLYFDRLIARHSAHMAFSDPRVVSDSGA